MNQPNQPTQPGQSNDEALTVDDLDPQQPEDLRTQWYNQYKDMSFADLARRMKALKQEVSDADILAKARKAEYDVISLRVVPERMLKEEQTSIRITGVGRLGISKDAWCTVIPGKKDDLIAWLKSDDENALLVKEDINPSTLKSLVKGMFERHGEEVGEVDLEAALAGADLTESEFDQISKFVNFTPYFKASVTKS